MLRRSLRASLVIGACRIAPLVAFIAFPLRAQTDSLSGSWTASAMTSTWKIGDWGDACGPRPSGGGAPAGIVSVDERGQELVISGAGRTYSTTECWEQFPGLTRTSHSAGGRNWRNTCRTPPGDPRQASLVTTISATPNSISFDETGQYQFVIKGQNCTASVRRTRFFRPLRAVDGGATTSAPTPITTRTSEPEREPAEERKNACETRGAPARLEVRPSRKLMRPGERFTFRASVTDARGCSLDLTPAFRIVEGPDGVSVAANGQVDVSTSASEGEVKLVAVAGGRSLPVAVEVVSRERFDALLAEGRFDESGASAEAAVAKLESASIGAKGTVLRDEAEPKRRIVVAVVGGLALALGLAGVLLLRRSRRASAAKAATTLPSAGVSGAARPPAQGMVCPTCREEFPPGAEFCPRDGNRLLTLERGRELGPTGAVCPVCGQGFDPGVAVCPKHDEPLVPPVVYATQRRDTPKTHKICPVCGAQYPGESGFCGKCGAALVPVN